MITLVKFSHSLLDKAGYSSPLECPLNTCMSYYHNSNSFEMLRVTATHSWRCAFWFASESWNWIFILKSQLTSHYSSV